jgi:carbonic anhydrase
MRLHSLTYLSACVAAVSASGWSYTDQKAWPGQCNTGTEQSPINIVASTALDGAADTAEGGASIVAPIALSYGTITNYKLSNNGHSIQVLCYARFLMKSRTAYWMILSAAMKAFFCHV